MYPSYLPTARTWLAISVAVLAFATTFDMVGSKPALCSHVCSQVERPCGIQNARGRTRWAERQTKLGQASSWQTIVRSTSSWAFRSDGQSRANGTSGPDDGRGEQL